MNLHNIYTNLGTEWKDKPVCGMFAIATISGKEVKDVFDHHKKFFHKGTRWKGASRWDHLLGHLADYSVGYVDLKMAGKKSVGTFVKHAQRDTAYLVRVGNHFVVVYNDHYIDQTGVHSAIGCRKLVSHAAKIL
jgi:hypothetical protein